jgi:hypothetical protein
LGAPQNTLSANKNRDEKGEFMKKNLINLLGLSLILAASVHASAEDGLSDILNDQRLDSTACLRALSSVQSELTNRGYYAVPDYAQRSMKVAFRLQSNEIVQYSINGISSETVSGGHCDNIVCGVYETAVFVGTVGQYGHIVESKAFAHAQQKLQINLSQMKEGLQLKGVANCSDFTDNSSEIHPYLDTSAD